MPTGTFGKHIDDLTLQAQIIGSSMAVPGVLARVWQIPSTFPSADGYDVQDPNGFAIACDRKDVNDFCIEAYTTGANPNDGRLGEVMASKVALAHMAGYERALQARYASPVRCRAWASARRAAHADLTYGTFGVVGRYVDDLLAAATAIDNSQVQPDQP